MTMFKLKDVKVKVMPPSHESRSTRHKQQLLFVRPADEAKIISDSEGVNDSFVDWLKNGFPLLLSRSSLAG
ncbi:hypothetical protein FRB95_012543 [Tulasnella sp. JGI-2019a]|nr:hypothetical protein FRB95_012543 [Tulasnella sp. JGI-2019a]